MIKKHLAGFWNKLTGLLCPHLYVSWMACPPLCSHGFTSSMLECPPTLQSRAISEQVQCQTSPRRASGSVQQGLCSVHLWLSQKHKARWSSIITRPSSPALLLTLPNWAQPRSPLPAPHPLCPLGQLLWGQQLSLHPLHPFAPLASSFDWAGPINAASQASSVFSLMPLVPTAASRSWYRDFSPSCRSPAPFRHSSSYLDSLLPQSCCSYLNAPLYQWSHLPAYTHPLHKCQWLQHQSHISFTS